MILSGMASPAQMMTRPSTGKPGSTSYDHYSLRMLQRPSRSRLFTKERKGKQPEQGGSSGNSSFSSQFNRFRSLTLKKSRNDKPASTQKHKTVSGNNAYYGEQKSFLASVKDEQPPNWQSKLAVAESVNSTMMYTLIPPQRSFISSRDTYGSTTLTSSQRP